MTAVLAVAVLGGVLLSNSKQTAVEVETPSEPEVDYTGFDRAVDFGAAEPELPQDSPSAVGAEAGDNVAAAAAAATADVQAEAGDNAAAVAGTANTAAAAAADTAAAAAATAERQSASQLAADSLSAADRELLEALRNLDAHAGVVRLHQLGYTSQQTCGTQPFIDDFALPDNPTQAIITPQNAGRTAIDVAAAVREYYRVQARVYQAPGLTQLFCLARVATLPKLEWKWRDLKGLVSRQASAEFAQPLEVRVVGLLTGYAVAVACLPSGAYGQLSLDNQPIAALLLLRWAGGRWRVSTAEDHPGEPCEQFTAQTRQRYEDDTADTGESWLLF